MGFSLFVVWVYCIAILFVIYYLIQANLSSFIPLFLTNMCFQLSGTLGRVLMMNMILWGVLECMLHICWLVFLISLRLQWMLLFSFSLLFLFGVKWLLVLILNFGHILEFNSLLGDGLVNHFGAPPRNKALLPVFIVTIVRVLCLALVAIWIRHYKYLKSFYCAAAFMFVGRSACCEVRRGWVRWDMIEYNIKVVVWSRRRQRLRLSGFIRRSTSQEAHSKITKSLHS
jgi:hypothetical protein